MRAYGSKGQKCSDAHKINDHQVKIPSTLFAPMRKGDPSQNYQELSFETVITFDKSQGSVGFEVRQTNATATDSDFDFISITLKSHQ